MPVDARGPLRSAMDNVAVYMADPWYTAADAVTSNLYLVGGSVAPPPPPPPPPPAPIDTSAPGNAQMLGGDGQLVANVRLDDVTIPLDYEIGLDITPGPNIIGDWSSIVHFTATNTNCCDYGSRIPGVWFWPGTRKILVVDGHGANGNAHTGEWGCDDSILTIDEGTTYRLQMVMSAEVVQILVDGALACQSTRADRSVQENVKVYMADPWYAAADAVVGNLYLTGGDIAGR